MSGKSVLLSRLGCGLVLLFGACFALDAWATLSVSPPTVTGTIHYSPTPPALTITAPVAVTIVNTQNLEFKGSLGTAGNLSINGVNIPLTPDHTFDYVTPLNEGPNTISFLGVDLGGNQTTLTRTIDLDTTPPDAPDTGLITVTPAYNGDISVSGAAGSVDPDTQITIVDLNTGIQVTVTSDGGGAFSTTIAAQTGDPIQIIATDPAGNTNDATAQVPVMITVTSLTLTTNQFGYVLTGQLDEAATLTVDGTAVQVNPDLTFSDPVPLNSGSNTFTLVATNPANNETFQTVAVVVLDDEPPTITITSPGPYTNQAHITITGSVSFLSGDGTLRDSDGNNIPLTHGAFSYLVRPPLQGGMNSFTFYATDNFANDESSQLTWSTIFDPGPLLIDATHVSATDILDGSGNPTGQTTVTGAAGAVYKDPNYGAPISVMVTGVASGQSAAPATPDSTGAFSTILSASAEVPFNIVATDQAGNSANLRVQFGTSCYVDSATLDTQLTVADGGGTISGPNGGTALFHITRSGELSFDTYVDYQTGQTGDTAVSGTDYTGGTGSFKIPAGATDADLSIPLLDSNGNGPDKTFTLHILGVHNVIGTSGDLTLGSCVTPVTVIGTEHYNIVPTTITVTGPAATTFESPYQVVTGSVTAGAGETVTLTVDGKTVTLNPDDTFSAYITLRQGTNNYTLVATDGSGNTTTLVETYTLNTPSLPAPAGAFLQFQTTAGSCASSCTVTITGQPGSANPGATVTVTDVTDGQSNSGTANSDGSFSVIVQGNLSDQFEVAISTADGQQSMPIFAHGDDAPLTLSVISPAISQPCSCATVVGNSVNISGTYTGPVNTGITVNSEPAQIINGNFYMNNLPLVPGTANTVNIVATAPGGLWTATTVTINSTAPTSTLVLTATPGDSGMAPLAMTFNYSFQGAAPQIQTVEMSYLGTCNSSISGCTYNVNSNDPGVALGYTYLTPGTYPATLTLIDTDGNSYQATLNVVVVDPSAIDAAIRKTWSDFTAALSTGNRAAALNALDYTGQQNYGPVFDALLPEMPTIVSGFSPLTQSSITTSNGEYFLVRTQDGQKNAFFVDFILDMDGVWRLDSM
jgi:hypothetical protein